MISQDKNHFILTQIPININVIIFDNNGVFDAEGYTTGRIR